MVECEVMNERERKPDTKKAQVLKLLRQGKSKIDISSLTGFRLKHVTNITYKLGKEGYFEQSDADRRRERRRAVSLGNGGAWASSELYAEMGMFTNEVYEALIQERGNAPFDQIQIGNALASARYYGYLRKLTAEDRSFTMVDARLPQEVRRERVRLWLDTRVVLSECGLERVPTGRNDWLLLGELLLARTAKDKGNDHLLNTFSRKLNTTVTPADLERLKPCFECIRDATPTTPQYSVPPDSMAVSSEVTPGERMFAGGPVRTFHSS